MSGGWIGVDFDGTIAHYEGWNGGELGKPISATLLACWPRGERYYHRNAWAGALQRNGVWILDSPASNAISHYVHLVMYLLGATAGEAALPLKIQAELYRANPIENYDTCTFRLNLSGDTKFFVALTHACNEQVDPEIEIVTDRAIVRLSGSKSIEVRMGDDVDIVNLDGTRYRSVIAAFAKRIRGAPDAPPGGTLEMARAHTTAINGASECTPVRDVPADWILTQTLPKDGTEIRVIREIIPMLRRCVQKQQLLSETGLAPWATQFGEMDLTNYKHFAGPKR